MVAATARGGVLGDWAAMIDDIPFLAEASVEVVWMQVAVAAAWDVISGGVVVINVEIAYVVHGA